MCADSDAFNQLLVRCFSSLHEGAFMTDGGNADQLLKSFVVHALHFVDTLSDASMIAFVLRGLSHHAAALLRMRGRS